MGVEVDFGRSVVEVEEHAIRFADGERLRVAAVIWAAGVTAVGTLASDIQERSGPGDRVRVTPLLQIEGQMNAWAVGDPAAISSGDNTSYP
jgi:NADH dehydrogenase FAD-containing subunit